MSKNSQLPNIKLLNGAEFAVSLAVLSNTDSALYTIIVNWCINQFRYDPVLIYGILQFKTQQDLNWFLLKWK